MYTFLTLASILIIQILVAVLIWKLALLIMKMKLIMLDMVIELQDLFTDVIKPLSLSLSLSLF
jgi:hypothetical protein